MNWLEILLFLRGHWPSSALLAASGSRANKTMAPGKPSKPTITDTTKTCGGLFLSLVSKEKWKEGIRTWWSPYSMQGAFWSFAFIFKRQQQGLGWRIWLNKLVQYNKNGQLTRWSTINISNQVLQTAEDNFVKVLVSSCTSVCCSGYSNCFSPFLIPIYLNQLCLLCDFCNRKK